MKINLIVFGVLLAIAVAAVTWGIVSTKTADTRTRQIADESAKQGEIIQVAQSFTQKYGAGNKIDRIDIPTKLYVVLWTDADGKTAHASLLINGIWVDLAQAKIPEQAPQK